ncbi:hypothetical protein V2J09_008924 [Rumex salicifolius]
MFIDSFKVESPNVKYTDDEIHSVYSYETTELVHESRNGTYQWIVKPKSLQYEFKTQINVPRLGMGRKQRFNPHCIIANREYRLGYKGQDSASQLLRASSIRVGYFNGEEIYAPFKSLLPMVNPEDIVFGGWDISDMNLADSMARAKRQLRPYMEKMVPLPGVYDPDFIAANQDSRANNVVMGTKKQQMEQIIKDMREFKEANKLEKVVVLWTANTERYGNVVVGLNDTMENLLPAVEMDENSLIGGDDFKSGQTKMKSVLVDFLVGAGIKQTSIVSYNHLGNNDGMNLSAPQTFRSKEISKSNVVDDMVASNGVLFEPGKHPDHVVVIKVN